MARQHGRLPRPSPSTVIKRGSANGTGIGDKLNQNAI